MIAQTGQLIVQLDGQLIQTLQLNMVVLTIGRLPDNGLMLDKDHRVSRNHAELRMGPQGPILTDLGSSNGTFVGDQKDRRLLPNQPHVLTDGTSFRIGHYTLTYLAPGSIAQPVETADEPRLSLEPTSVEPVVMPVSVPVAQTPQLPAPANRYPADGLVSLYSRYLPDIFQEDDFLRRFLLIFQEIWEPLEQRQDHIAMYFDPHTCPTSFLPWLASWFDLSLNMRWPEARIRALLAEAMDLYSLRGTHYGLMRMIEICTGFSPVITDVPSRPFVFRIRITSTPGSAGNIPDRALIEELIQAHKPAHAGYVLEIVS